MPASKFQSPILTAVQSYGTKPSFGSMPVQQQQQQQQQQQPTQFGFTSPPKSLAIVDIVRKDDFAQLQGLLKQPMNDPTANDNEVLKVAMSECKWQCLKVLLEDQRICQSLARYGAEFNMNANKQIITTLATQQSNNNASGFSFVGASVAKPVQTPSFEESVRTALGVATVQGRNDIIVLLTKSIPSIPTTWKVQCVKTVCKTMGSQMGSLIPEQQWFGILCHLMKQSDVIQCMEQQISGQQPFGFVAQSSQYEKKVVNCLNEDEDILMMD